MQNTITIRKKILFLENDILQKLVEFNVGLKHLEKLILRGWWPVLGDSRNFGHCLATWRHFQFCGKNGPKTSSIFGSILARSIWLDRFWIHFRQLFVAHVYEDTLGCRTSPAFVDQNLRVHCTNGFKVMGGPKCTARNDGTSNPSQRYGCLILARIRERQRPGDGHHRIHQEHHNDTGSVGCIEQWDNFRTRETRIDFGNTVRTWGGGA